MSNNIKCPNCNEVFKVDDNAYLDIVKQVRDTQFNEEIKHRLDAAEQDKKSAIELTESKTKATYQELLAKKEQEINELKLKSKTELINEAAKKDELIRQLQSKIEQAETQKKLEVSNAVSIIEKEKNNLENELKNKATEQQLLEKSLNEKYTNQLITKDELLKVKEDEIQRLKDYKQKLSTKMLGESLE